MTSMEKQIQLFLFSMEASKHKNEENTMMNMSLINCK